MASGSERKGSLSESDRDDYGVRREMTMAWVLGVKEAPKESYDHFRNVLRYAATADVVSSEQLAQLLEIVDNFIVPQASREAMVAAVFGRDTSGSMSVSSGSTSGSEDDEEPKAMTRGSSAASGSGNAMIWQRRGAPEEVNLTTVGSTMEHPTLGVRIGRQRHMMRSYDNVFTGTDATQWFIDRNFAADEAGAVKLGNRLLDYGYFVHIFGKHHFENANYFYRFKSHPEPLTLPMPLASAGHTLQGSLLHLMYSVHNESVPRWLEHATVDHLRVAYPVVLLWARQNPGDGAESITRTLKEVAARDASLRLALWGFHRANGFKCMTADGQCPSAIGDGAQTIGSALVLIDDAPPAKRIREFEAAGTEVQHPFANETCTVKLRKEFVSAAKPSWMTYHDSDGKRVMPDAVAKVGDDLRQDLSVQVIFQVAEACWAAANVPWRCGRAPTVGTFGVVVTNHHSGYMEMIQNAKTVKDVVKEKGWKKVNLRALAPSIVGALMSGFVLGVRDRHSENQMLVNGESDAPSYTCIDYGYLLMDAPGGLALDTPRLTLQPELIKLLKKAPGHDANHTLMDDIKMDLVSAYRVLRQQYAPFVSLCKVALSTSFPASKIEGTLWGTHCFRAGMSERKALKWLTNKVETQLTMTNFRRGAKHAIVKMYYGVKSVI